MQNKEHQNKENEEKMILAHEPVPGYPTIFWIVLAAAVIYLALIFMKYTA